MTEDWGAVIEAMNGAVRNLRQAGPEVMKSFSEMARAATDGRRSIKRPRSSWLLGSALPFAADRASAIMPRRQ